MKWGIAISLGLLSFSTLAAAQTTATPVKPLSSAPSPNVTIVNGKKFFSLTNVHHFTASGPSALQVIHHPRAPGTIMSTRSTVLPAAPAGTNSAAKSSPNDVLSVFAPEDRGIPAASAPAPSSNADPIRAVAPPASYIK